MKQLKLAAAAVLLISLTYCKSKQKAVEPTPAPATPPATASKSAGEIQMEIAQTRWPGTTAAELSEGQGIYVTRCTSCHKAYNIPEFGEKKWLHEIDDMSPKAKLNADEKLKLTKYILSYRETKEKMGM